MATYGVIADVHGNLHALQAVLARLEQERVDHIVCLGDLVGYNAGSNACVDLLHQRGIDCIAGNHDLIAQGRLGFERCAMRPEFALRRTRETLSPGARAQLGALPARRRYEDGRMLLFHGGLDDPCEYLRTPGDVARTAATVAERFPQVRIGFFGHTHEPGVFGRLDRDSLTLVNPGSVDAARRDDKRAQFAVFDAGSWALHFFNIPYDHEAAERAASVGGYRMGATNEAVYRARRLLRGGRARAGRLLRRLTPVGSSGP